MVIAAARRALMMALMGTVLSVTNAWAQVTPAAGKVPPDDTPSLRVGFTLWPQFILQTEPQITDAAGNTVQRNTFDVGVPISTWPASCRIWWRFVSRRTSRAKAVC